MASHMQTDRQTDRHTYIHTYTCILQCSYASVRLTQARSNYPSPISLQVIKERHLTYVPGLLAVLVLLLLLVLHEAPAKIKENEPLCI